VLKLALLPLLVVSALFAQTITTGDITGTVKDQTGAVVPNATVDLKSRDTGETRSVTAGSSGEYRFTTLKPGNYQISAATPGLKTDVGSVVISIGQVVSLDLTLKPESSKEIVMVTDTVPILQSDNANQSTTLSARQVLDLPLPGGDTTTVAFTVPGVTLSTAGGYGNFSSHGLPGVSNLFTVNGNDNMDPYLNLNNTGASNLTLGANEIAEVAVVQNGYTAAYGRQAGAQVNTVTKSGTNEFHGNLIWNWNGAILNANDFFANASGTPRGRAVSNQYAASLGGPIVKNKTFFFVDTEGIRYVLPSLNIASIPTPQFESYLLSTAPASAQSLYQQAFNLYNNAAGANRAVNVTNGNGNLQDSTGALGCGSLMGTPLSGGGVLGVDTPCARAFGSNATTFNPEWLFSARVDHQINDKQRIFFRYKMDRGTQSTYTDPINPAFDAVSIQPSYEGQVDHTYVITPSIVNHVILSASYYSAIFTAPNLAAAFNAFPTYFQFGEGGANGTGSISSLGLNTTSFPQGRNVGQGSVVDDLSWVKGKHSIKVGANFRYNRVSDHGPSTLTEGGAYLFGALPDFASGTLSAANGDYFEQRFDQFQVAHLRLYNVGFYVQDEWSAMANLKFTVGLRMDRTSNIQCLDNCFARLNGPFSSINQGLNIPYNASITTGLSEAFPAIEPLVYQPRFGFVWNPGSDKKTVVRGGFGIFSDQPAATLASSIFGNSPNIYTPVVRLGTVGNASTAGTAASFASAANAGLQQGFAAGDTLAQIDGLLPAGIAFTPPNYFSVQHRLLSPKYMEWSFEIQRELGSKNVVNLSYTGNHGYNLFLRNQGLNTYNQNGLAAFDFLPTVAPDPRFRVITNLQNDGVSNYNGFTAQYRRAFAYGFQGQVNYTWSHALDDVSNGGLNEPFGNTTSGQSITTQIYPYNKSLNYSSSDYDIRHSLTGDFTWDVPFKASNKYFNAVVGGWNWSSKVYARTGTPFSVYAYNEAAKISSTTGGTVLATILDPGIQSNCSNTNYVNVPCFSPGQLGVEGFGNYPRNSFRSPGYFDIDLSGTKSFAIGERYRLAFGATFYNIMNHPNFANPNGALGLSGLGLITSTVTPPTSAYGSFEGSAVSGRVIVTTARFTF
jgi:hypothetical protein